MEGFDKSRVINFSDAVFSIAATLLVLDLGIPTPEEIYTSSVALELSKRVPSFIGFVVSFFVIFLFWKDHMHNLSYVKKVDSKLLSTNIMTLLFIVLLPFTTGFYVAAFNEAAAFRLYCLNIIALSLIHI